MNIKWVISKEIKGQVLEPMFIGDIASSWGSYETWKLYNTDNCICNELDTAKELLDRSFNKLCNLWLPESFFIELGRPDDVQLFGGAFTNKNYLYKDDIVALNLISKISDIILLLGFNLSDSDELTGEDRISRLNYYRNIKTFFKEHPNIQFVLVNYDNELSSYFDDIPNLLQDTAESVKELL